MFHQEGATVAQEKFQLPPSRVYIDPYEVDARLAELAVQRTWLEEAALQGELQRRLTSPLEFDGAPAYKAASMGLRVIRELSIGAGWHPERYMSIPVAFNNDETVAISVTEGDEYVGVLGERDPSTKAIKGPNTAKVVDDNRLFEFPPVSFWYFLTYSDERQTLRAELSSPAIEEGGRVSQWLERILLGSITGTAVAAPLTDTMPPAAPAPEVVVRRRSA